MALTNRSVSNRRPRKGKIEDGILTGLDALGLPFSLLGIFLVSGHPFDSGHELSDVLSYILYREVELSVNKCIRPIVQSRRARKVSTYC